MFTRPAKHYLILLFLVGISVLFSLNYLLYIQGLQVQKKVHEQAHIQAQTELFAAIEQSFELIDLQLVELANSDEVHQQLNQPSYYFYWRDQRLQQSSLFKDYYLELELYRADGHKLAQLNQPGAISVLPERIKPPFKYFLVVPPNKDKLIITTPIQSRESSQQTLGYLAVAIDFYQLLIQSNQFFYLDRKQLHFNRSGIIQLDELTDALDFQAVSNPVSDELWDVITSYITQFNLLSIFIVFATVWIMSFLFIKPLKSLSNYIKQLSDHPLEQKPEHKDDYLIEEYLGLKKQFTNYHLALMEAQNKLHRQNRQLWQLSRQDPLTELPNRRAFDEAWHNTLEAYDAKPMTVGYILFDCDHFKALNDSYGHQVGDQIILEAAKALQRTTDFTIYRIGGDEFAILVIGFSAQQVENLALECQTELSAYPFSQIGIHEKVSFSLGISFAQKDQPLESLKLLPKQADIAMYKAKHSPLEKIHFYQHEQDVLSDALVSTQVLHKVLAAAHTGQYIQMYYQPIMSVSGDPIYYETLVRLNYAGETIYPNDIFTIVDHHGLETELDQNILKQLLIQMERYHIKPGQGISINLSAKTLLQPFVVELFEPFLPYLAKYKIVIEITENVLINHFNQVSYALNKLRRQGFLIALDDFGSGYSSIRYLASMPVDIIKFDLSLTHALDAEQRTRKIIESTAKMIRQAGYQLVMEGIETDKQLQQAKQAGATAVQGYLIGRPQPVPFEPGLVI